MSWTWSFSAQPRADGDEAQRDYAAVYARRYRFSAQPRADGDEAQRDYAAVYARRYRFSAQPRADGDEADGPSVDRPTRRLFQCSTASRWG